ncbi:MAG: nicotinamide riboside transporter PnuC [Bacteroidota bacterium]|jgi:nicotinamide mononucleotide transporter
MDKLDNIGLEILNTTVVEWIAVFASLAYVIFIARKSSVGWFFAVISSGVYVYICFVSQLYLETLLQIFYVGMACWGWFSWHRSENSAEFITRWRSYHHLQYILFSAVLTLLLGYLFDTFSDQSLPYLDAFTTVFSIGATFMVVRRVLENWVYWVIIDMVSVYLYYYKELNMTALMYSAYTVIAIFGYYKWLKAYRKQARV